MMRVETVRGRRVGVRHGNLVEALEGRRLLTATVLTPMPNMTVAGGTSGAVDLSAYFADSAVPANTVFLNTNFGVIPVQLTPTATPVTVQNFLNYVTSGRYNDSIIHRSVPGFVIQGGGFALHGTSLDTVQTDAPIANEFSASRPNATGTIAMAKTSDPDSATSQFFINLANNTNLNSTANSGGFTTFGQVIGSGMTVVNSIAGVPVAHNVFNSPFEDVPLIGFQDSDASTPGYVPTIDQFVLINSVTSGASFAVTSDNPSILAVDVHDKRLVYTPGTAGVAHVTVTATGLDGQSVSGTFAVTVVPVTIGQGGYKSVSFKDADGTAVTISLSGPGSATIDFNGSGVTTKGAKGTAATATGSISGVASIVLSGATASTVVTVTTKGGNGAVDVASISASGAMGTFNGKGVNLVGDTTVGGALKSLTVKSAAAGSSITASSLGTLSVVGNESGNVSVSGAVGTATVGGTLGGTWILGSVKKLSAGQISGAGVATTAAGSSMGTVTAKKIVNSQIRSKGNIVSLVATGGMSGSQVYAGLAADAQASADAAAQSTGQILSIKVGQGSKGNAFANSTIAAGTIKNATLGNLVDAVSAAAFYGVEADTIVKMTGFVNGKAFAAKDATTQAQLDQQLAKAKVSPTNLKLVVM